MWQTIIVMAVIALCAQARALCAQVRAAVPAGTSVVPIAAPTGFTATAVHLNFDSLPAGTIVTTQFQPVGIVFGGAVNVNGVTANMVGVVVGPTQLAGLQPSSTPNALAAIEDCDGKECAVKFLPFPITFTKPVQRVGAYIGNALGQTVTLTAFDAQGHTLGSTALDASSSVETFVGLDAGSAVISSVHVSLSGTNANGGLFLATVLDDLYVEPAPVTNTQLALFHASSGASTAVVSYCSLQRCQIPPQAESLETSNPLPPMVSGLINGLYAQYMNAGGGNCGPLPSGGSASVNLCDTDGDGVPDSFDNCRGWYNPRQGCCDPFIFGHACDLSPVFRDYWVNRLGCSADPNAPGHHCPFGQPTSVPRTVNGCATMQFAHGMLATQNDSLGPVYAVDETMRDEWLRVNGATTLGCPQGEEVVFEHTPYTLFGEVMQQFQRGRIFAQRSCTSTYEPSCACPIDVCPEGQAVSTREIFDRALDFLRAQQFPNERTGLPSVLDDILPSTDQSAEFAQAGTIQVFKGNTVPGFRFPNGDGDHQHASGNALKFSTWDASGSGPGALLQLEWQPSTSDGSAGSVYVAVGDVSNRAYVAGLTPDSWTRIDCDPSGCHWPFGDQTLILPYDRPPTPKNQDAMQPFCNGNIGIIPRADRQFDTDLAVLEGFTPFIGRGIAHEPQRSNPNCPVGECNNWTPDENVNVVPDSDFVFLGAIRQLENPEEGTILPMFAIHAEWESQILSGIPISGVACGPDQYDPHDLISPRNGARIEYRGLFVVDCGHDDPLGSELHPNEFALVAEQDTAPGLIGVVRYRMTTGSGGGPYRDWTYPFARVFDADLFPMKRSVLPPNVNSTLALSRTNAIVLRAQSPRCAMGRTGYNHLFNNGAVYINWVTESIGIDFWCELPDILPPSTREDCSTWLNDHPPGENPNQRLVEVPIPNNAMFTPFVFAEPQAPGNANHFHMIWTVPSLIYDGPVEDGKVFYMPTAVSAEVKVGWHVQVGPPPTP